MQVYRIHKRRHDALDGTGAALLGGRWNPRGTAVVYASPSQAGTLLEVLARLPRHMIPTGLMATRIVVPEDCGVDVVDPADQPDRYDMAGAQDIGWRWVEARRSLALRVPSYVARPWGWNIVLNPAHPDFGRVRAAETAAVRWDSRLFPAASGAGATLS